MYRILIVDDEPLIRSGLKVKLEQFHEEIVVSGEAENGIEALEWLKTHYADICITDVKMPKMSGLELVRQINQAYPWMENLVISSYDEFEYAKQSVKLGAIDYILKPIDQDELLRALGRATEKLDEIRRKEAADLLARNLPHYRQMLQQWVNQVQTLQIEQMPLLVVDTLEMLGEWVNEKYYLLNALSMVWLRLVIGELEDTGMEMVLEEGKDLGLGEKTITVSETRFYFRLCAVRRLEEGAHRIFSGMKETMNQDERKIIREIKQYIEDHYDRKLTLQELADYVSISKNYLPSLFKLDTGKTIWSYVVELRMHKAKEMLLSTDLRSYEIANRIGYENSVHFSRIFKEQYGLTPMEYKKRMNS